MYKIAYERLWKPVPPREGEIWRSEPAVNSDVVYCKITVDLVSVIHLAEILLWLLSGALANSIAFILMSGKPIAYRQWLCEYNDRLCSGVAGGATVWLLLWCYSEHRLPPHSLLKAISNDPETWTNEQPAAEIMSRHRFCSC